jgi:nitronate monooxygenase
MLIIQGGMGMGVSDWRLARAVSSLGQLGVVSGTALDTIFARRLQGGDPGGRLLWALANFPVPEIAERVIDAYYRPEGMPPGVPYKQVGMFNHPASRANLELCVVANFVEVFLAKEGHSGAVGINLLEKILLPNLPSLYGAMLAGVDVVLMGAGIPREIPGVLDRLARHEKATVRLPVYGSAAEPPDTVEFDPQELMGKSLPAMRRPRFFAIIASTTLGIALARKCHGGIDGFVIEGPRAGGHNAPPRGDAPVNERGEPVYGARDEVDLEKIKALNIPFWLAGSYGSPEGLQAALRAGANGIQVGTAFAFCQESGFSEEIRSAVVRQAREGTLDVFTNPVASPTGFPFKILRMPGTLADEAVYEARHRVCDLGYLRSAYRRADGTLGYRCPAEPAELFAKKNGAPESAEGRVCLCNGLQAAIGLGQRLPEGEEEPALITAGDDVNQITRFIPPGQTSYTARDVIETLLAQPTRPDVTTSASNPDSVAQPA